MALHRWLVVLLRDLPHDMVDVSGILLHATRNLSREVRICWEACQNGFAHPTPPRFRRPCFYSVLRMEALPHGCKWWLIFIPEFQPRWPRIGGQEFALA